MSLDHLDGASTIEKFFMWSRFCLKAPLETLAIDHS